MRTTIEYRRQVRGTSQLIGLRRVWPVAVASVLALALGLWELGRQSFDIDEGVSAYEASQPLRQTLGFAKNSEPNNLLYFGFLWIWEKLGHSEELLRFPSVVGYVSAVPLTAAIAWRSAGRPAGIAAGFLLALNAFALERGQDARAYAILLGLVAASTLCFTLAIERSTPRRWGSWALVSALSIYAHPFAAFVVVAQALSLAWLPSRRVPWREAGISAGAMALAVLPLFALLASQGGGRISWIDEITGDHVLATLERLSGYEGPELVYLYGVFAIVIVGIAVRERPRRSERAWLTVLPALWLIIPLLLAVAVSLKQPTFYYKYLTVVLPGAAIVAAITLVRLRPWPLAVAAVAALCALHLPGIRDWYRSDLNEDWRGAARIIGPKAVANETIYFHPFGGPALAWYLGREVKRGVRGPGTVSAIETADGPEGGLASGVPRLWLVEMERAEGFEEEPVRRALGDRPALERWHLNRLRVSLLGPPHGQLSSSSKSP